MCYSIGKLEITVNGMKENHIGPTVMVPYGEKIYFRCSAQNTEILIFSNTTIYLKKDLAVDLSTFIFACDYNTINFRPTHCAFYYCICKNSTVASKKILLTSGE